MDPKRDDVAIGKRRINREDIRGSFFDSDDDEYDDEREDDTDGQIYESGVEEYYAGSEENDGLPSPPAPSIIETPYIHGDMEEVRDIREASGNGYRSKRTVFTFDERVYEDRRASRASPSKAVQLRLDDEDDESELDLDLDSPSANDFPTSGDGQPLLIRSNSMPTALDREEMIDFDVMKRRSRLKAASKLDKPSMKKGRIWFFRVLLFPLFSVWWWNKLNGKWFTVSLIIYFGQAFATFLYLTGGPELEGEITTFEIKWTIAVFIMVAGLLGHCAAVSSAVTKALKLERMNMEDGATLGSSGKHGEDVDEDRQSSSPPSGASASPASPPTKRSPTKRSSSRSENGSRRSGKYDVLDDEDDDDSDSSDDDDEDDVTDSEIDSSRKYQRRKAPQSSTDSLPIASKGGGNKNRPKSSPPHLLLRKSQTDAHGGVNGKNASSLASFSAKRRRPFLARSGSSPRSSSVRSLFWSANSGGYEDRELTVSQVRNAIHDKIRSGKPHVGYVFLGQVYTFILATLPILYRFTGNMVPILCWVAKEPSVYKFVKESYWLEDGFDMICQTNCSSSSHHGEPQDDVVQLSTADSNNNNPFVCLWGHSSCEHDSFPEAVLLKMYETVVTHKALTFIAVWSMITTGYLLSIFFQFVSVAEDAFRRRLMYAKYFSKLTSSRRARKAGLPHFRLNKVNHIRVWLDLRSDPREAHNSTYKFGDAAANALVVATISAVTITCLRMFGGSWTISKVDDVTLFMAASFLSSFMYRFVQLATRTKKKYDTSKILYTEQLNLYIKIFSNPTNKEELVACNNMLKIAVKLTSSKEEKGGKDKDVLLLSPIIYNLLRVTILSALGTMSGDFLGFKIRLWKL